MLGLLASLALAQSPQELVAQSFGRNSAEFLLLLDTALPVKEKSQALLQPISEFLKALPDNDRVALVAYHTRSTEVMPLQTLDEAARADIGVRLPTIGLPSANESDLGAGVASLNTLLEQDPVPKTVFVLVFTDYCHDPSVQSPWDGGGRGCRTIRGAEALQKAWKRATNGRSVQVVYLPIPGATLQSPEELRGILGKGEVATDAEAWLKDFVANVSLRRYGPVAKELLAKSTVSASVLVPSDSDPSNVTVKFALGSSAKAQLENLQVKGGVAPTAPLPLNPTGELPVEVEIPPPPFVILPRTQTLELHLQVQGELKLLPETAWSAMGIEPVQPVQTWDLVVPVTREIGSPRTAMALGLSFLGALGGLGVFGRRVFLRQPLNGHFWWRHSNGPREPLHLSSFREANIMVFPDGNLGVGPPDKAAFVIWKTSKTEAFVEVKQDGIEINSKRVSKGRYPIVPGATSFQMGEYRLTWE